MVKIILILNHTQRNIQIYISIYQISGPQDPYEEFFLLIRILLRCFSWSILFDSRFIV